MPRLAVLVVLVIALTLAFATPVEPSLQQAQDGSAYGSMTRREQTTAQQRTALDPAPSASAPTPLVASSVPDTAVSTTQGRSTGNPSAMARSKTASSESVPSTGWLSSSSRPAVGVYVGPAMPSKLGAFASSTGATPTVAVDFMDGAGSWDDFANVSWLLDPWTTWLKADSSRKLVLSVPMLINSAEGDYDNTRYDQYHVQVARNIASRGIASQVVIRLGWEMNGTWFPWSTNAEGYKRMWRRLIPQYRAVSSAFRFDWCTNGGVSDLSAWYPGDDVVDIITMDMYDIIWRQPGGDQSWRWSQIEPNLQGHVDFARARGKPAAIDEWSVWNINDTTQGGGGDNPTYVTNMMRWAADHTYAWLAYFDVEAGGPDTTLEQNPNSLNAYRRSLG